MMEKMTQSNATVANLLTNFTPTYTIPPVVCARERYKYNEFIFIDMVKWIYVGTEKSDSMCEGQNKWLPLIQTNTHNFSLKKG